MAYLPRIAVGSKTPSIQGHLVSLGPSSSFFGGVFLIGLPGNPDVTVVVGFASHKRQNYIKLQTNNSVSGLKTLVSCIFLLQVRPLRFVLSADRSIITSHSLY